MNEDNLMAALYVGIVIVATVLTVACIRRWIPEFRDGWENLFDRRPWIAIQQLSKAHVLWMAALLVTVAAAYGIHHALESKATTGAIICVTVGIIAGFKIETWIQIWRIRFFNQQEDDYE